MLPKLGCGDAIYHVIFLSSYRYSYVILSNYLILFHQLFLDNKLFGDRHCQQLTSVTYLVFNVNKAITNMKSFSAFIIFTVTYLRRSCYSSVTSMAIYITSLYCLAAAYHGLIFQISPASLCQKSYISRNTSYSRKFSE